MDGPLEVRGYPRHLSGTEGRTSVTQHSGRDDAYLVKQVIPGDDVKDISSLGDIWSVEPLVNRSGSPMSRPTHITNEPSRVIDP